MTIYTCCLAGKDERADPLLQSSLSTHGLCGQCWAESGASVPGSSQHALCRDDLPSLAEALVLLKPAEALGVHPADQQAVTLAVGKFGPYVRHGKVNAPIPKVTPSGARHDGRSVFPLCGRCSNPSPLGYITH